MEPEDVLHSGLARVGVALGDQGHGYPQTSSFKHKVFCGEASVPSVHSEGEGKVLPVTQDLVAQELCRGDEVSRKVAVRDHGDILPAGGPLEGRLRAVSLLHTPPILINLKG